MLEILPLAIKFETEYEARVLATELWDVGITGHIDKENKLIYVDSASEQSYVQHVIKRINSKEIT